VRLVKELLLACLIVALPAVAQETPAPSTVEAADDAPKTERARKEHKRAHTPSSRLTAQMQRDLALSADQAAKIQEINDGSIKALQELRPTEEEIRASRRQQRQILADRDKELKAILSEQQYGKLMTNREKYEKRMRNAHRRKAH
jgi:hypothetical protein